MSSRNLNNFLEGFSTEVLDCYSVFPHLPAATVIQWSRWVLKAAAVEAQL